MNLCPSNIGASKSRLVRLTPSLNPRWQHRIGLAAESKTPRAVLTRYIWGRKSPHGSWCTVKGARMVIRRAAADAKGPNAYTKVLRVSKMKVATALHRTSVFSPGALSKHAARSRSRGVVLRDLRPHPDAAAEDQRATGSIDNRQRSRCRVNNMRRYYRRCQSR